LAIGINRIGLVNILAEARRIIGGVIGRELQAATAEAKRAFRAKGLVRAQAQVAARQGGAAGVGVVAAEGECACARLGEGSRACQHATEGCRSIGTRG